MSWLGIDIGTSSCKAALYDDQGTCLAAASESYALQRPEAGAACLDYLAVCTAWRRAIAAVCAQVDDPPQAVSISSQGEAVVGFDAAGVALTPVLTSLDSRPLAAVQTLLETHDSAWFYERSGHTLHPMFSIAKLAWMQTALGDQWPRIAHIHCLEDALQRDLGLSDPAMSHSLAGRTMLFDVRRKTWSDELCACIDLDPALLPRCLPAGAVAGLVGSNACDLPTGIPVVCGGHDQGMGALGAGVSRPGEAMYATGSIECICPALGELRLSESLRQSNLCSYDFTIPGLSTTVAFSLTGGNALAWFRSNFARELPEGRAAYDRLLDELPDDPSSLLCLPYLAPSGTPHFHPQAMGALLGLDLAHDRGHVLKGLLEGIALEMRLNAAILADNGLPIDRFLATGGAARSRVSTQLKADVLGRPVAALTVDEAGCLGGAMLARAARNGEPITEAQAAMAPQAVDIEPRPTASRVYSERFDRYRQLYQQVQAIMTGPLST